ncbi:TIGR04282 family arsenosugar biosynthesis glycosyltransferase [Dissulfurispira thermophila]|nr:TIGR04282 family arsenosugar biosynthesis glycosyltransferase [Dissulfurispira thermophila]
MFRIPEYGKVKRRLAAQIGNDKAFRAYVAMLYETIQNVSNLTDIDIYGFYEGAVSAQHNLLKIFQSIPQHGEDLGEKMFNAIKWLFEKGHNKAILIGADSPDLPIDYIKDAFTKLDAFNLVIGPVDDGGYYLIGMDSPLDTIFKGMKWGSNSITKDTISIAERQGIKYFLLPQWYDIDDIEGLNRWSCQQPVKIPLP